MGQRFCGSGYETFDGLSYDPDLGPTAESFDPVSLVKATKRTSLNSQRFIERFNALDTAPIQVVDADTQEQRNSQIVQITRRICGERTQKATDAQVLSLYGTFLKGWF